jgi:hypothetical protein
MQPPTAAAAADKRRTITLTNRAPIKIIEDDWPVIAQGACGQDHPPYGGWGIEIRVRRQKSAFGSAIIHAKYELEDPQDQENGGQTVRVGRILRCSDEDENLWNKKLWLEIAAVGEELRSRIAIEGMRKYVTYALDDCFAQLPPTEM